MTVPSTDCDASIMPGAANTQVQAHHLVTRATCRVCHVIVELALYDVESEFYHSQLSYLKMTFPNRPRALYVRSKNAQACSRSKTESMIGRACPRT